MATHPSIQVAKSLIDLCEATTAFLEATSTPSGDCNLEVFDKLDSSDILQMQAQAALFTQFINRMTRSLKYECN